MEHSTAVSQETGAAETLEALEALDNIFHQKARLGIMSTLLALNEADFRLLKETLALSDGNLSTHLALLEERGYLASHKEFVRRKPRTTYTPTEAGRQAFLDYLAVLERVLRAAERSLAIRSSPPAVGPEGVLPLPSGSPA